MSGSSSSTASDSSSSGTPTPKATPDPLTRRVYERVSIKKRKVMKLGRKMARLRIGRTREMFVIHEDLICSQSAFLREKLQRGRKAIEGECPICHDIMDPITTEITFCRAGCGRNVHYNYMESWKEQKSIRSEAADCPLCRHLWPAESQGQSCLVRELSAAPFDSYRQWLYSRQLPLVISDTEGSERTFDALIRQYELGQKLRDKAFSKAVLESLCEAIQDTDSYPSIDIVASAYKRTANQSPLRQVLIDIYISQAEPAVFEEDEENSKYPRKFLIDLAMAFLRQQEVTKYDEQETNRLKDKHCMTDEGDEGDESSG